MTTNVHGVKFSDQMAALVTHAEASGFRIEPETRGRRSSGLIAYAPDKAVPPITINEVKGEFHKAHFENVRRALYRAGMPPLPGEAASAPDAHLVPADERDDQSSNLYDSGISFEPEMLKRLDADDDSAPPMYATAFSAITESAGLSHERAALLGAVTHAALAWAATFDEGRDFDRMLAEASKSISDNLQRRFEKDIEEALAMAQAAEGERDRAVAAMGRSDAAAEKARADCGDALRRAEAAEAKAAELEAAVAPLRALLGKANA